MKGLRKILTGAAAGLAVLVAGAGVAVAASDAAVSGVTNHTIYKVGNTVTITGTVNGDIFCAGSSVHIDATVNGDVICAGQAVTVNGTVNGNIRVAGQTVNVGAKVNNSATAAGQDITMQSNSSVGRDLTLAGGSAYVDGKIGRDVSAAGNTLNIDTNVGRDVNANVAQLNLGGSARVGGDIDYTSQNRLERAGGAVVDGSVTYHKVKHQNRGSGSWHGFWLTARIFFLVASLVFAMVLVALFPQLFGRWTKYAGQRVWAALLTGFVAMFAVPVAIIALALTLVGFHLAIVLGLVWLVLLALSGPFTAFYVGRLILPGERRAPLIMLVGAVVVLIVYMIPVLGFLALLVAMWFGTGCLLLNLKSIYKKPNYKITA
jgi:hypothetical protein